MKPPVRWYWHFRIHGLEHLPRSGPVLLVMNHTSFLDPWFVGMLPRYPIRYLIDEAWYNRSLLWRFLFRSWWTIPVATGRPEETQRRVQEALKQGHVVGIFPEGKISHDGSMNRFRLGIGFMAAASGAPVVPCAIRGSFESLPRTRRFPRRSPVSLHLGEPLFFPGAPTPSPAPAEVVAFVGSLVETIRSLGRARVAVPRRNATGERQDDPVEG